nr:acyltransferase [Streptosporangium roseum]
MVASTQQIEKPVEKAPVTQNPRLPSLTGMRFVAAAMVFFFHVVWLANMFGSPEAKVVLETLFGRLGFVGVGFFFVLSGFVLAWSVRTKDRTPAFWRRRFFKIYPSHLVTYVVAFLLVTLVAQQAISGEAGILNLLLLHAWFPQMDIRFSVNPIAWSLACEALFYLMFPLLMRYIRRIRPERLWAWAAGVAVVILAVPVVADLLPYQMRFPSPAVTDTAHWFIYTFPPVRMLDFVFGILLARMVMTGRKLPLGLGGSVALAVIVYALTPLLPGGYSLGPTMVVPLGFIIAAAAANDVKELPSWLSGRVMGWLGEVSYAFYLWNALVLVYGHKLLADSQGLSTPLAIGMVALLFGVTLLLSWLLFSLVERPIMRRFATSRRRRAGEPQSVARRGSGG